MLLLYNIRVIIGVIMRIRFFLALLVVGYFCYAMEIPRATSTQKASKRYTILVHGTRLMSKSIEGIMLCTKEGLHPMSSIENKYIEKQDARILDKVSPEQFPIASSFFFGWSGELSYAERSKWGAKLYKVIKSLKSKDPTAHIRIVTISHGGNVALAMAQEWNKEKGTIKPVVDELVMLCSPIMNTSEDWAESALFKSIFHLYSHMDLIQTGDPLWAQSKRHDLDKNLKKPRRRFRKKTLSPLPNKLRQANISMSPKLKHLGVGHTTFFYPEYFMKHLPRILKEMRTQKNMDSVDRFLNNGIGDFVISLGSLAKQSIANIFSGE